MYICYSHIVVPLITKEEKNKIQIVTNYFDLYIDCDGYTKLRI